MLVKSRYFSRTRFVIRNSSGERIDNLKFKMLQTFKLDSATKKNQNFFYLIVTRWEKLFKAAKVLKIKYSHTESIGA